MTQITQDGFTFDSDWIDISVARFLDKRIPWAFRMKELQREIDMREIDLDLMLETQPHDGPGHAHSRAHLKELKRTWERLKADPEL
jgi:hypothetical protein